MGTNIDVSAHLMLCSFLFTSLTSAAATAVDPAPIALSTLSTISALSALPAAIPYHHATTRHLVDP